MPPKNLNLSNAVLYFGSSPIGICDCVETLEPDIKQEDIDRVVALIREPVEATFEVHVPRLSMLSLVHGHKVTNNWLKMHGGIMSRRRWK